MAPLPARDEVLATIRGLEDEFADLGGEPGFLYFTWWSASSMARIAEVKGSYFIAAKKNYKKKLLAAAERLVGLDDLIQADKKASLLSAGTRRELEYLIAVAKRTVSAEDVSAYQKAGHPPSHLARYFHVPALLTRLDAERVPRERAWDWLTRWCRTIESVTLDWRAIDSTLGALRRGDATAIKSLLAALRVTDSKELATSVRSWWQDTAVKSKRDDCQEMIVIGLIAYRQWGLGGRSALRRQREAARRLCEKHGLRLMLAALNKR